MRHQALSAAPGVAVRPNRARIWVQAVRVPSFTASVIPILVGSALALLDRAFQPFLFVIMIVAAVACHAGSNLANDYFDHVKGVDTAESLGSSKVIRQELLTPAEVRRGMIVAFGVATLLGLVIVSKTGWPIFVLALLSLGAAVLYTGGPKPLGHLALGEVVVFLFMGPVMVVGAYYVLTGHVSGTAVITSLPIGFLVSLIMQANNIRDIDVDRQAGKATLATIFGRRVASLHYLAFVVCAYLAVAAIVLWEPQLWPVLIVAASIPAAVRVTGLLFAAVNDRDLNLVLRKTAGLHLRFGALLMIGIIIAALIERLP
jgi:1,4-dihydroxy-2-naphthoate octaprenyltransferase